MGAVVLMMVGMNAVEAVDRARTTSAGNTVQGAWAADWTPSGTPTEDDELTVGCPDGGGSTLTLIDVTASGMEGGELILSDCAGSDRSTVRIVGGGDLTLNRLVVGLGNSVSVTNGGVLNVNTTIDLYNDLTVAGGEVNVENMAWDDTGTVTLASAGATQPSLFTITGTSTLRTGAVLEIQAESTIEGVVVGTEGTVTHVGGPLSLSGTQVCSGTWQMIPGDEPDEASVTSGGELQVSDGGLMVMSLDYTTSFGAKVTVGSRGTVRLSNKAEVVMTMDEMDLGGALEVESGTLIVDELTLSGDNSSILYLGKFDYEENSAWHNPRVQVDTLNTGTGLGVLAGHGLIVANSAFSVETDLALDGPLEIEISNTFPLTGQLSKISFVMLNETWTGSLKVTTTVNLARNNPDAAKIELELVFTDDFRSSPRGGEDLTLTLIEGELLENTPTDLSTLFEVKETNPTKERDPACAPRLQVSGTSIEVVLITCECDSTCGLTVGWLVVIAVGAVAVTLLLCIAVGGAIKAQDMRDEAVMEKMARAGSKSSKGRRGGRKGSSGSKARDHQGSPRKKSNDSKVGFKPGGELWSKDKSRDRSRSRSRSRGSRGSRGSKGSRGRSGSNGSQGGGSRGGRRNSSKGSRGSRGSKGGRRRSGSGRSAGRRGGGGKDASGVRRM